MPPSVAIIRNSPKGCTSQIGNGSEKPCHSSLAKAGIRHPIKARIARNFFTVQNYEFIAGKKSNSTVYSAIFVKMSFSL